MSNTNKAAIDAILDGTLDDLADAPEFKPFPAGAHICVFDFESKIVNNKPAVEVKLKALETSESSDPEGAVVTPGQETTVLYLLRNNDNTKNEIAEGKLKLIAKSLSERFPGNSLGEILAGAKGAEVLVVTKVRTNKSSGQENTDIVSLSVI